MVALVLTVVVLCAALGVCLGAWLYARNEARYWEEVCTKLVAELDTHQKKEENNVVMDGGRSC